MEGNHSQDTVCGWVVCANHTGICGVSDSLGNSSEEASPVEMGVGKKWVRTFNDADNGVLIYAGAMMFSRYTTTYNEAYRKYRPLCVASLLITKLSFVAKGDQLWKLKQHKNY